MATVQHSALTGAELHEPKGAAAASEGMVYRANGAGSGAWTYLPSGWENAKDDSGAQAFTSTPALLSIDSAGATSDVTQLPREIRGVTTLWDPVGNRIAPITEGDAYELRLDLPVTAESGSPTELTIELDIQAGSTYGGAIKIVERFAGTGRSTPYNISVGFPVFCGATFFANGGQFWVYSDTGTVTVTNPGIVIARIHAGDF